MIDDEFYNEQEQWDRVKRWLRENGPWIIAGVLLGLGALWGWQAWQDRQERIAVEASVAFEDVVATLERGDAKAALESIATLRKDYSSSPYAQQADLLAARIEVDTGDFGSAAERLARVMNAADDEQLRLVARTRLARVQLAQGNADAALASIQGAEAGAFAARFAEIRGDALFLKGDKVAALAAWREAEALASDPNVIPTVDVDGIRLKIADTMTDETPAAAAATSAEQAS